ncbi:MAG: amidohydrolase family protein [Armatimonadota bacterium]|jgi:predicted TIM-barrel fold metal-dependent hydrolase
MNHKRSIFDIHVHFLGNEAMDSEFLRFALDWGMPFATSCLGHQGSMIAYPTFEQCRLANDAVLRQMAQYPDMVYGFCYVSQEHEGRAVEEVRRCIGEGMRGVKLWVAVKVDDERTFPIAEEAIAADVPILIHSYLRLDEILPEESKPWHIAALARRYPELKIIMAHMALHWWDGVDMVADCPNIYVDTSGCDPELGSVEYAVAKLGPERVLYGSDGPGRDVLCQIGRVMAADIPEADKEKVLHLNAKRLLKLEAGR